MIADSGLERRSLSKWAAIFGNWTFDPPGPRYAGVPVAVPSSPVSMPPGMNMAGVYSELPRGVALSNARFRGGTAQAKLRFEPTSAAQSNGALERGRSGGILLGYQGESGGYVVAGLGAFDAAYALWEFVPQFGWKPLRTAGSIHNLRYGQDYQLKVTQRGQRFALEADSVSVIEYVLPTPLTGNQLGLFAWSDAPIQFEQVEVVDRPPLVFMAMQFGEPYDTLYRTVMRPKAQALGFEVLRIDEVRGPGIIFEDIQRKIEDADVVIAEITAPNQNVFYEVGYAHALKKPTILLAQRGKELPFDIRSYRVIFYDDSIGGKPAVERTLREHLQAILHEG